MLHHCEAFRLGWDFEPSIILSFMEGDGHYSILTGMRKERGEGNVGGLLFFSLEKVVRCGIGRPADGL